VTAAGPSDGKRPAQATRAPSPAGATARAAGSPGSTVAIDPAVAPASVMRLLERTARAVERDMERRLPLPEGALPGDPERVLVEAMRYAALGPGKRLRPALVLAACEAVGAPAERGLPAASAVELLHSYTLVHDDLPAMDDDDERRGRPTVHRAFGEATAILVGDGLLTAAFAALVDLGRRAGDAVAVLARRAGAAELLAGQALDLAAAAAAEADVAEAEAAGPPGQAHRKGGAIDLPALERIHARKTGALFAAACELGAIAGDAGAPERRALADYGMALGIAFQHADDVDDAEFVDHRAAAAERRVELARQAIGRLGWLGPRAALLADLASWVGGLCGRWPARQSSSY
jgi:geranylgeranyl pyrophosphate synthase